MSPAEREQRIREIAERLTQRLDEEWPEGNLTINDIEDLAERVGQDVQREITERFVREEAERKEGHQAVRPCGDRATYRGHNELTVVAAGGRVRVRRAYY